MPWRHALSKTYACLADPNPEVTPDYLMKWESDLGMKYTPGQEQYVLLFAHRASISTPTGMELQAPNPMV